MLQRDLLELRKKGLIIRKLFLMYLRKIPFTSFLALVVHFNLEVLQMDVKTTLHNGDLEDEAYMKQLKASRLGVASI